MNNQTTGTQEPGSRLDSKSIPIIAWIAVLGFIGMACFVFSHHSNKVAGREEHEEETMDVPPNQPQTQNGPDLVVLPSHLMGYNNELELREPRNNIEAGPEGEELQPAWEGNNESEEMCHEEGGARQRREATRGTIQERQRRLRQLPNDQAGRGEGDPSQESAQIAVDETGDELPKYPPHGGIPIVVDEPDLTVPPPVYRQDYNPWDNERGIGSRPA